jgi:hypothetical protein
MMATIPGARIAHRASLVDPQGNVSALCFDRPRAIRMDSESTETWVLRDEAVTCPKCLERIAQRGIS